LHIDETVCGKGGFALLYDGVIFDLDGTLWDSCQSVAASWAETLAERHGALTVPTEEDVKSIMGMTAGQIAETLFSAYGQDALAVCLDCIARENAYIAVHGARLYPGVEALFQAMSGSCGLYIVSNCQQGYIECFLEYTGFGKYIQDYECSGATGLGKAENIRLIARRNGLRHPVYVGDTHMDQASAVTAGLPFIHAAYGFGHAEAPDGVIKAPLELLDRLRENHV